MGRVVKSPLTLNLRPDRFFKACQVFRKNTGSYDCTKQEDLLKIIAILREFKRLLITKFLTA